MILMMFLLTSLASGIVNAQQVEGRGMWVVRNQLTSPEKIQTFVDLAVECNFNFLVVQVSGRGDAYYNSQLLPRAEVLHKQPLSFDPLQMTLDLAHKKGLKVIAWVNDMFVAPFKANPVSKKHIVHAHPDWITYHYDGSSLLEKDKNTSGLEIEGMFLEPGLKEVREHIVARYQEIVTNYDVDGIHHDYIRYANPNLGYHPETRAIFKSLYNYDPLDLKNKRQEIKKEVGIEKYYELKKAWDQFRRDNVTQIVKEVYETVKRIKPDVEVSAAVVGYYKAAYETKFQDWKVWLEAGYLDVAMPMIYEPQNETVNYMVDQALAMQGQGVIFIGLGAYTQLENLKGLVEKVTYARERGAAGILFFDYGSMYNTRGYLTSLKEALFSEPADYPQVLQ